MRNRRQPTRRWQTIERYEDLYSSPGETLTELLERMGLDPAVYDFAAAEALPVRGSSQLGGQPRRITWDPRPRRPDFDPLDRGAELRGPAHLVAGGQRLARSAVRLLALALARRPRAARASATAP